MQGELEKALAIVANHEARVTTCGRTDTGVHALGQVAHFDSPAKRSERSWVLGLNSNLPDGISVRWVRPVDDEFHARFTAFSRSYRYRILNRWVRPALENRRASWVRQPLDEAAMNQAAQYLLGEHDFTSFRATGCQATHAVREIQSISVAREGEVINLDISANGFLYHMVRNIAGSLIRVGKGKAQPDWIRELLIAQDRKQAAPTAQPDGLYFLGARFPEKFGLPDRAPTFQGEECLK